MQYGCVQPGLGWMGGRCWKCKPCLAWRATLRKSDWASRSCWEIFGCDGNAWFVTLTFRFKPKEDEAYGQFQRYIKKVRKARGSAGAFRYVCASEFGERNGRYHLHAIVCVHGEPIVSRQLRSRWSWGITHARAIRPEDAGRVSRYVGKYVAKAGRIRASNGWGNQIERVNLNVSRSEPTVASILEAFPGAKVTGIKAQDSKRVRAPYHLRRPARQPAHVRTHEWLGIRPDIPDGLFPSHWVYWGAFSCLPDSTGLEGAEGE